MVISFTVVLTAPRRSDPLSVKIALVDAEPDPFGMVMNTVLIPPFVLEFLSSVA
jgi:hypothetical protein